MTLFGSRKVDYQARIDRAEFLAERHPFAAEVLHFYQHVAGFQKRFYEGLPKFWGTQPIAPSNGDLRSELNLPILLEPFREFLSLIKSSAPGPLAAEAQHLEAAGQSAWTSTLEKGWRSAPEESGQTNRKSQENGIDPLEEFLVRAFLQPYAEFVAAAMLPPNLDLTVCRCPWCDALPSVGVLRQEADGGKRFLQCSFCSQEWPFRRIFCASCGEEDEKKLNVYIAELFPYIRVEVCETCKHCLRTIDLTKDGKAIPIVDDLAAIPLSLWAEERGYVRIQPNLLGT